MPHSSPFPSVPVSNESMHAKLIRAIRGHVKEDPDKVALISAEDESSRLTYAQLLEMSNAVQAFLQSRGMNVGDVVTFTFHNCLESAFLFLGTWMAGGVVSGASASFTTYELKQQFADSKTSVVVADEENLGRVLEAAEQCEHVKTVVCIREKGSSSPLPAGVIDFTTVMAMRTENEPVEVPAESVASLPYSSGTTGAPKGVMLSHQALGTGSDIRRSYAALQYGPLFVETRPEIRKLRPFSQNYTLMNLPVYHLMGFNYQADALLRGATIVIRFALLHPPLALQLAKEPLTADYDLTSLQVVLVSAAALSGAVANEFRAKFPHVHALAQALGMTEAAGGTHYSDLRLPDEQLCIGFAAPSFEHKVVDVSTGVEVADGSSGELCVRSPTLMLGYLNRPQATAETIDKDEWLHTGDLARIDSEGRAWLAGRLKELIKVDALPVPPTEVEDVLLSHELVHDAAVVGIPDQTHGEIIRAYIVRKKDVDEKKLAAEELLELVKNRLAPYKHITGGVVFVDELPKSPAGKILRRELKERASKECENDG